MNKQVSDLICACFDVTADQITRMVKLDPSMTFDDLMARTRAGTKCTACLLDLEYLFVAGDVPRDKSKHRTPTAKRSFKHRVYDLIDSCSPWRPTIRNTIAPVIAGSGIEEYFWIANRALLFDDDEYKAIPHRFSYVVRDADGRARQSGDLALPPGSAQRINISSAIRNDDQPFSVGTFEIKLWGTKRGFRGTTRAQIEILTARAACSVHTQGPNPHSFHSGVTIPCTADDRTFFIIMNPYDHRATGQIRTGAWTKDVDVPAFGTGLVEIDTQGVDKDLTYAEWTMRAGCKLYMLCANQVLDRFSVDHV